MKVGDYVRTKNNGIGKIIKIKPFMNDINIFLDSKKGDVTLQNKNGVFKVNNKESIIKSSPNIIDLIEENDLVKIEYYSERYKKRLTRLFEVYYKDEKHINLGNVKCEFMLIDNDFNHRDKELEPVIKSIITKEQFKEMEYRIGDD